MQYALTIGLCLLAAGLGWLLRKLYADSRHPALAQLEASRAEVNQLKIDHAVAAETLKGLHTTNASLSNELEACKGELLQANNDYVEASTLNGTLNKSLEQLKIEIVQHKSELAKKCEELEMMQRNLYQLRSEKQFLAEKLESQKAEVEGLGKKFEDAFTVLAQRILEDKTRTFTESQEQNLKAILEPLQKEIKVFKEEIDAKHRNESEERISLREQVRHMSSLNQTLSEQANRLTETLRLQVKQQGDWGESILESILENSGLQKDLQYQTQFSSKNDEGKTIRPDVVVSYPDGRKIIIDSKVSLVAYYNMCNAQGKEDEELHLKDVIRSVRAHIDGLSEKNYGDISHALDFIVMFVPVEPAYIAAMHGDPELWQYAYKKGILLISPANLIATLKIVKDMWRKDAVDKNAQAIAEKAGRLYDKLVGFVDTFEKVGSHLDKARESWDGAFNQLKQGKGNMLSIGLKLKALNIQSKKDLSDDLASQAILHDKLGTEEPPLSLYE